MGIDVRDLTFWQLNAMIAGYAKANGSEVDDPLSGEEFDRLGSLLDQFSTANGHG